MRLTALEVLQKQITFLNNNDTLFQFKLARELGMTVGELTTRMSNKEYNLWVKFYNWEITERNKMLAIQEAENKKKRNS
jgi:hypothetical protein